ncbi:MAG: hypothetical protein ACUVUE_08225 [Candidatus Bathycorpusculaceae bacterium]
MNRKTLALYFLLLFVVGIFIRIFISPLLWPGVAEVVDLSRTVLTFVVVALVLGVIYYIRTQGSLKQVRLFYTVTIGLGLGFPIYAVSVATFNFFMGYTVQGTSHFFVIVFSYIIAFMTAAYASKKIQQRWQGSSSY